MGVPGVTGHGATPAAVSLSTPVPPPETQLDGVSRAASQAVGKPEKAPGVEEVVQQSASASGPSEPAVSQNKPRIRIDSESRKLIAQIVDENRQVVKQIPPEEVLRIAANFRRVNGLLFDQSA